jgi:hypothetical protein
MGERVVVRCLRTAQVLGADQVKAKNREQRNPGRKTEETQKEAVEVADEKL